MSRLREGRTILTILLLVFALYFLILGMGYGRNSRIFPLAVGIPTVILMALTLWAVWRPDLLRGADVHLAGLSTGAGEEEIEEVEEIEENRYAPGRVLRMVGWLLLAGVGIALVGFRVTVPVYILLFSRIEGRAGWVSAVLLALLCWAFIVGYFDLFMRLEMFKGILFGAALPVL